MLTMKHSFKLKKASYLLTVGQRSKAEGNKSQKRWGDVVRNQEKIFLMRQSWGRNWNKC